MEPGLHARVAEALDAEQRLLARAEHSERLVVELALQPITVIRVLQV